MSRILIVLFALVALVGACSEVDRAGVDDDAALSNWCAVEPGTIPIDASGPDAEAAQFEADLAYARELAENAPAEVAAQAELVLADLEDRSQRIEAAGGDMGADPGMSPDAEEADLALTQFRDRACP